MIQSNLQIGQRPLAAGTRMAAGAALLLVLTAATPPTTVPKAPPKVAPAVTKEAVSDPSATFFMGRIRYSNNTGNDCTGVGDELIKLVSRVSTIRIQQQRVVSLSDDKLFETPFVFMNGHNDFVLTDAEIASLRKFLQNGGFFFASGCCTNPQFPEAWRREFGRLLKGEKVQVLNYDHLIYRSFYKIDRVKCLHINKDIKLEGLYFEGRLVAVICEEGLCCSFSMSNRCNSGKGVAPEDGQRLALNIAVYALTH